MFMAYGVMPSTGWWHAELPRKPKRPTLGFIDPQRTLTTLKPVVSPPGIRVTGRSLAEGLDIVFDPGHHRASDLFSAIVANNPADAAHIAIGGAKDSLIYRNGGHVFVRAS